MPVGKAEFHPLGIFSNFIPIICCYYHKMLFWTFPIILVGCFIADFTISLDKGRGLEIRIHTPVDNVKGQLGWGLNRLLFVFKSRNLTFVSNIEFFMSGKKTMTDFRTNWQYLHTVFTLRLLFMIKPKMKPILAFGVR